MRLRSRQHLRRQSDFAAIRKDGRRQFGAAFVFSFRQRPETDPCDLPRFAVVASRRVGPATDRNRLKRRLREIFREHQHVIPADTDIVVTFRQGASTFSFAELKRHFTAALKRSGLSTATNPESKDE
jgi:ribonuclease P protein component